MTRTLLVVVLLSVGLSPSARADGHAGSNAPILSGSPSLVVDGQVHLGEHSDFFRDGMVFLWADSSNTALGTEALYANTSGGGNSALGDFALGLNTSGSENSTVGFVALPNNTSGSYNSAFGGLALFNSSTGSRNVALGHRAGYNLGLVMPPTGASTYSNNIFIDNAGGDIDENTIRIGNPVHERAFIKGIHGTTTDVPNAIQVFVDSVGQLGTTSSSRAAKQDIEEIGELSRRLLKLSPVAFRFRQHALQNPDSPRQFGLIAEDVAEIFPELVAYDQENRPLTVKYHLLSSLLLNELQKQHRQQQVQWLLIVGMLLTGVVLIVGRWRFG